MHINRGFLLSIGATLVAGALGGYATRYLHGDGSAHDGHGVTQEAKAKSPALAGRYVCPMHADVVQDRPGSCPICGMHLVKAGGKAHAHHETVHVDQQTEQRMGVQIEAASRGDIYRPINAFAAISSDESSVVSVNSKVEGWIRRMHVAGVGQVVRKGQLLYELYSPELQQRQREYVDLLTRRESMLASSSDMMGPNSAMLGSLAKERFRTRDRLLAADVPPDVVEALEKSRRIVDVVPIRAARDGVVTAVSAREGVYVNPMQPILAYADNSKVWAEITVFPDQLGWIRNGDDMLISSSLDPKTRLRARVNLDTLQVDPVTRTVRLRVPLQNPGHAFQPGSYADVVVKSGRRHALNVPAEAVIRTGRGNFVVVNDGNGHYRSVAVRTGLEGDRATEILSGLSAGEKVVVNGQFLLDGASSMQAMQHRLAATRSADRAPAAVPAHQEHGTERRS